MSGRNLTTKSYFLTEVILTFLLIAGCAQNTLAQNLPDKIVGGGCEDCRLIFEGIPSILHSETTIPPTGEPGETLILRGTIYKKNGKTPAPGILFYVYHTDNQGLYSRSKDQPPSIRHGHLRGWIKTGADGRYQFTTIKPQPYPNARIPAHVHPLIKEPGMTVYYIDEYLFEGDPFLTEQEWARQEKRGGSGIIKLVKDEKGVWIANRDIILGMNIPDYPK